jgi:hypothetical protein
MLMPRLALLRWDATEVDREVGEVAVAPTRRESVELYSTRRWADVGF